MPKPQTPNTIITLDAAGQTLGRLASRVAMLLRGKHKVTFRPDVISGEKVIVKNVGKILVSGRKAEAKIYPHFSGYPGGLRIKTFQEKIKQDPKQVFRLAVKRMLPDNRTRKHLLKRLTIHV
ncbi:50S ribosomal protein L13 [Candidatus Parcubacteria bacterium]|jgi:large subunit ribosomal protein L13|nr:MAG: 50S ribosomal protein L13 [Candidatus Parcubacteria bacterium]